MTDCITAMTGKFSAALVDGQVKSLRFLEAVDVEIQWLSGMGTAFVFVVNDIQGNVDKLRRHIAAIEEFKDKKSDVTFAELVKYEADHNRSEVANSATDALLWLSRALEFLNLFLDRMGKQPTLEPRQAIESAYEVTLAQYHNFFVRQAVWACFLTLPHRQQFEADLFAQQAALPADEKAAKYRACCDALSSNLGIIKPLVE